MFQQFSFRYFSCPRPGPTSWEMKTSKPLGDPSAWTFSNGPEFPGAEGGLERSPQAARQGKYGGRLVFDFSGGGNYVGATVQSDGAPDVAAVRLWLKKPAGNSLTLRYTDQSGQTLQKGFWAPDGRWVEVLVPLTGWMGHWGGNNDGTIHGPPKSIGLLVENDGQARGALLFRRVAAVARHARR